jgi:hypothetical protein
VLTKTQLISLWTPQIVCANYANNSAIPAMTSIPQTYPRNTNEHDEITNNEQPTTTRQRPMAKS